MGDRKQPTPMPPGTVRPDPPPAPPRTRADGDDRCVIGEYCRTHQFVHGAEAEELRQRLEALDDPIVTAILDDVDARDSLAWIQRAKAEGR
jgi:hypothetical protein